MKHFIISLVVWVMASVGIMAQDGMVALNLVGGETKVSTTNLVPALTGVMVQSTANSVTGALHTVAITNEVSQRIAGDASVRAEMLHSNALLRAEIDGISVDETDPVAMGVLATNRTDKLWSSSSSYVDGDGVTWEIMARTNDPYTGWDVVINSPITIINENGTNVIPVGRTHWPEIPYPLWTDSALSLNAYSFREPTGSTTEIFIGYYYKSGEAYPHRIFCGGPSDLSTAQWFSNYGLNTNDVSTSPIKTPRTLSGYDDSGGPYNEDVQIEYVIGDMSEGVTVTTNRIDSFVLNAEKELHKDSYTNLIWNTVYSNGWVWLAAYTNTTAGGQ